MTIDERLDRLPGIVGALASSVVAHDDQIDALIRLAAKHEKESASLKRQWQAYLNTLPRQ